MLEKSRFYAQGSLPVRYEPNSIAKENVNRTILNTLGISYEEFDSLGFDEQQKIIREYHRKNSKHRDKTATVMIGNSEHSAFVNVKSGERVMIGSGEHSCFVEAELTLERSKKD